MSAQINRDNPETSVCEAQVYNVLFNSRQCPTKVTSHTSSGDCTRHILPGMHGIGIASDVKRAILQNSRNVESSKVLLSQDQEMKCGAGTGGCQQTSPTLHMPELSQKSSDQREALLHLHVEKLQRVLEEQARLLSLLRPGPSLAPVLSAQWLNPAPALIAANHADTKNGSPSATLPSGARPSHAMTWRLVTANHNSGEHLEKGRAEQRNLSPIREEPAEEPHPVSPFGDRGIRQVNPEDRPIRPAVGERRKTFEDFLEEQLNVEGNSLSEANQSNKDTQMHPKKFLRKGDGVTSIGKIKVRISDLLKSPSEVVDRWEDTAAQNVGQIFVDKKAKTTKQNATKSITAAAGHLRCTVENDASPVSQCQTSVSYISASHASENKRTDSHDHIQYSNLRTNSLHQTSATSSDRKVTFRATPQTAGGVAFKKVNDQIVRVCQRAPRGTDRDSESDRVQSSIEPAVPDMLSLATELTRSLHCATSGESSGSEDDPESQCHRDPMPPTPPAPCQEYHNLDLSDGDYASDAPSEAGPCRPVQTRTCSINSPQLPYSSDDSDSELTHLSWNRTDHSKKPAEVKMMSASQLLASIFPQIEPADKKTVNDKLKEKFVSAKNNRHGDRAPAQTQRDLTQAIKAEVKHDTLLDELKNKQDKAMQFLRDSSRNDEKSTRGEMDNGVALLHQQIQAMQELVQQKDKEWSRAHGHLQSRMDLLIRENQELRGRLTRAGPATQTPPPLHQPLVNPNQTFHTSVQKAKDQRPSTPFRMSSANSGSLEGTQSQVTHHRSHVNNGRKASWVSEDSPRKLLDRPYKTWTPRGRRTPPVTQTTSSDSDHMDNNKPSALQGTENDVREEILYPDGKVEQILSSGCRIVIYRNGTKKEVSADEKSVTITFFNGDVKQILADGKVVYYYHDSQASHTTFPSGLEVLHFANNQTEEHHPDGSRNIIFPDGTIKHIFPDGREESTFPDGTVVKLTENGEKSVDFTNGQREIQTSLYKRREYPDGTVKTVYWNGRQKTRSTGKVGIRHNEMTRVKK
ncbi:centromere protein J isoform X2 [Alosa sapidissima]|uniref:centromere protein J isoform X2 n=1 Tax=Alosa sapidissima TaxID=34773 RepID=UPI001C09C1FC|nr:centromere protein J isoform X2 [Alosa sapidissima]